jgi:hypothetical protein
MSPLTLQLPQTLRYQLEMLAQREGVSLDQYILYSLARQVSFAYTLTEREDTAQQRAGFVALLENLGTATDDEIQRTLADRERVEPDARLPQSVVARVREQIAKQREN